MNFLRQTGRTTRLIKSIEFTEGRVLFLCMNNRKHFEKMIQQLVPQHADRVKVVNVSGGGDALRGLGYDRFNIIADHTVTECLPEEILEDLILCLYPCLASSSK